MVTASLMLSLCTLRTLGDFHPPLTTLPSGTHDWKLRFIFSLPWPLSNSAKRQNTNSSQRVEKFALLVHGERYRQTPTWYTVLWCQERAVHASQAVEWATLLDHLCFGRNPSYLAMPQCREDCVSTVALSSLVASSSTLPCPRCYLLLPLHGICDTPSSSIPFVASACFSPMPHLHSPHPTVILRSSMSSNSCQLFCKDFEELFPPSCTEQKLCSKIQSIRSFALMLKDDASTWQTAGHFSIHHLNDVR